MNKVQMPKTKELLATLGLERRHPARRAVMGVGLTVLGAALGASAVLLRAWMLGREAHHAAS